MADGVSFVVRVTPRSGRDEIVGWRDGVLQVRLRAPPVEGQANRALSRLLAQRLDVAPASVEIITGATGRNKRLRVVGLSEVEVRSKLGD